MKKNSILTYFLVSLIIFDFSRASIISSQYVELGLLAYFVISVIVTRKPVNPAVFFVVLLFVAINFLGSVFGGGNMNYITVVKITAILILYPFFALLSIGEKFWEVFEDVVYKLTLISLPLFLLNVVFPEFFNELVPIFRNTTRDIFYQFDNSTVYWSSVFYVNAIKDGEFFRNSGFMWEPGSFAMIIIVSLALDWLKNGVKFNKRFFVYFIALLTTMSTAGYLAIFSVLAGYYLRRFRFGNLAILLLLVFSFITYIYTLDFVGVEIGKYMEAYEENRLAYNYNYQAFKVNRIQIAAYDIGRIIEYPFGYGYGNDSEIIGVNGLSSLAVMWGLPVFIFQLILLFRFVKYHSVKHTNIFVKTLLITAFLIMFFSNPIDRTPFIYFLLWTPLIFVLREYGEK